MNIWRRVRVLDLGWRIDKEAHGGGGWDRIGFDRNEQAGFRYIDVPIDEKDIFL